MKKKVLLTALITAMVLSGCGSASEPSTSADTESLNAQIEALQKENEELKSQLEAIPESTVEETQSSQSGMPIAVGEKIVTDNMEITINKVELTYDVLPDDTSSFYTHYEADPGNVYLHLDVDVKNLGKQNLSCDQLLKMQADYNTGYTYDAQPVPEDSGTGFTYANLVSIKPLETLGVHYLFKCPQEVDENENPLFITIEPIGSEDSYTLTIR